MAADEGKFGRLGEVRACWCPPGITTHLYDGKKSLPLELELQQIAGL